VPVQTNFLDHFVTSSLIRPNKNVEENNDVYNYTWKNVKMKSGDKEKKSANNLLPYSFSLKISSFYNITSIAQS
jgi:hypothetical protein